MPIGNRAVLRVPAKSAKGRASAAALASGLRPREHFSDKGYPPHLWVPRYLRMQHMVAARMVAEEGEELSRMALKLAGRAEAREQLKLRTMERRVL